MSIEPINSIMSLQQQTYTPAPKPVQPVSSSEISQQHDTAASTLEDIAVVAAPNEKGNADNSENPNNPNQDNQQANSEQIRKAVEQLKKGQLENSEAVFGFHEETNRVTIKIVDKQTKEVIKELPPEKTLDMIAKVWEIAGLFVNEKR